MNSLLILSITKEMIWELHEIGSYSYILKAPSILSSLEIAPDSVKLSSGTPKGFLPLASPGSLEAWGWKAKSEKITLRHKTMTKSNYLLSL